MENRYAIIMSMVIMCAMSANSSLQACMATFFNDSARKVAVFNELDKTFMCIPKNGKRRFGNHHNHASFMVYIQQPKAKIDIWTPAYTCKQNTCGSSGNVLLKLSDIQNNAGATDLFTVIKHKPHGSMVGELPMIQKKTCNLCKDE